MKPYVNTANGLRQSRCGKIGTPEGEKMPMRKKSDMEFWFVEKKQGIGIFYE
jgi:hypothetical protein